MHEQLKQSLKDLTASGERELYLLQTNEAMQDYWQQRQDVINRRSEEIQQAVHTITQKYEAELDLLDQDYAMYVSMITPLKSETKS